MKAKVTWLDGRAFVGESGSGHAVVNVPDGRGAILAAETIDGASP